MPRRSRCILPGPACPAMSPSGESTAAKPSLPTRTVPPISVSYARTSRTPKPASSAGASCPTTCISLPSRGAKTPWRFCCGAFTADTRSTTTSTPGGRAISGKTASSPARWVASAGPWGGLGRGTCYRGRGRHHQTAALYVCRTPVWEREFGQSDLTAIRSLLDPWTSEERANVGSRIQ